MKARFFLAVCILVFFSVEVQNHIIEHDHLPNIPSAKEIEANGIELGLMNMKLL